jgi:hypothetical protein
LGGDPQVQRDQECEKKTMLLIAVARGGVEITKIILIKVEDFCQLACHKRGFFSYLSYPWACLWIPFPQLRGGWMGLVTVLRFVYIHIFTFYFILLNVNQWNMKYIQNIKNPV